MAYTEHSKIKQEKYANAVLGLVHEELVLTQLVTPASFDEYKGAKDDTVNVKVPGLLPARSYNFRNDRTDEIVFDTYSETSVPVTFTAGRLYSALRLTDEQVDFDDITTQELAPVQAQTVARGMEHDVARTIADGTYSVAVDHAERDMYAALVQARALMRKFRSVGTPNLVVGTDFEASLLLDKRFTAAVSSGTEASGVMRTGNIGNWLGFNIFVSDLIPADEAIAFTEAAFASATAAPSVPQSVPFGTTVSAYGKSLRWIKDYDTTRLVDRSVVDCYFGSKQVLDRGWVILDEEAIAKANGTNNEIRFQEKVLDGEFNVRSFKINLGAADAAKVEANADFLKAVKVSAPNGIVSVPDPAA